MTTSLTEQTTTPTALVSYVFHSTTPADPTVAIETGISAGGKAFHTVNVRDARSSEEAVQLMADTLERLNGPSEDAVTLRAIVALYLNAEGQGHSPEAFFREVGNLLTANGLIPQAVDAMGTPF